MFMHNTKDKHICVFDVVDNNVFPHSQAAVPGAEIFFARTSDIGEARKCEETVCDGVNQVVSNLDAAALLGDIQPDVVQIGFGAGGYTCAISEAW